MTTTTWTSTWDGIAYKATEARLILGRDGAPPSSHSDDDDDDDDVDDDDEEDDRPARGKGTENVPARWRCNGGPC
jgi:hypothetical protein